MSDNPQEDVECGLDWLLGFSNSAMEARIDQLATDLSQAPPRGCHHYGPVESDRVAWYLLLARAAKEAPTNLDVASASRVLPMFAAIGRNASILDRIGGVEERVQRWLSPGEMRNPDAVIFELLVGACYGRHGWSVEFIPETSAGKRPDLLGERQGEKRWIECKRLAHRSEASRDESKHWGRLWSPLCKVLVSRRYAVVFDITFRGPMEGYSDRYLVDRLATKLQLLACDGVLIDDEELFVKVAAVDMTRVRGELIDDYVKVGTAREAQLISGRHEPRRAFSSAVEGSRATIGAARLGQAQYWDSISFACGSYWECSAQSSMERRARDIRPRLSKATTQVKGDVPSSIHVGLETHEGEHVEDLRLQRILDTVSKFHAAETELDWIFCHLFGPETPPDKAWDFGETVLPYARGDHPRPVESALLVVPEESGVSGDVHWNSKLKF